ncbi:putative SREBP regulating gene protein [Helianthus anomalus]
MVSKQRESCDFVCKSVGHSCVASKFVFFNECGVMQKYMKCKGSCLVSIGADLPVEVAEDAPRNLNPSACLYTRRPSTLSCDGSQQHIKRFCPCA